MVYLYKGQKLLIQLPGQPYIEVSNSWNLGIVVIKAGHLKKQNQLSAYGLFSQNLKLFTHLLHQIANMPVF